MRVSGSVHTQLLEREECVAPHAYGTALLAELASLLKNYIRDADLL
jgi:hypothetical protein